MIYLMRAVKIYCVLLFVCFCVFGGLGESNPESYAYVIIWGESTQEMETTAVINSLRWSGTRKPIVILRPSHINIPRSAVERLSNDMRVDIRDIDIDTKNNEYHAASYYKLYLWSLVEFSAVIFLEINCC